MQDKPPAVEITHCNSDDASPPPSTREAPLRLKVISTVFVCLMGFGTYYNQGLLGAVKTPLKKTLHIDNTQFSLITSTSDLCLMLVMPFSGLLTDYLGGAAGVIVGSSVGVIGSIIVASAVQVRSWQLMMFGTGLLSLGNITNANARYRLFSAWFPPNHGFALTLSLELAAAKMGLLVSKALANVIADGTGELAWAFWVAMFADLGVLFLAVACLFFVRACRARYGGGGGGGGFVDPATGERLVERTERFDPARIADLPYPFWCIVLYHVFQTTALLTFVQNLTEIVQARFAVPPKTAGWISGVVSGGNFVILPPVGALIDRAGHRLSVMCAMGLGMTLGMALLRWATAEAGTAVALAVISVALAPTFLVAYDGVRSSLWHQDVYGTANAVKVSTGYAVSLSVRVGIGALQDRDHGEYDNVILVYLALGIAAATVAGLMILGSRANVDVGRFQWSRKQRAALGEMIAARTKVVDEELEAGKSRLSVFACSAVLVAFFAAIGAYIYACRQQ